VRKDQANAVSPWGRVFPASRGQEDGAFHQTAEFFFANLVMGPIATGGIEEGLVSDFFPVQVDDAKVFTASLPGLVLLEFHEKEAEWGLVGAAVLVQRKAEGNHGEVLMGNKPGNRDLSNASISVDARVRRNGGSIESGGADIELCHF